MRPLCAYVLLLAACSPQVQARTVLRGQVLYGPSTGLSGALVRAIDRNRSAGVFQTLTGPSGEYRFSDLPVSDYVLFVSTERWIAEASPSLLVSIDGRVQNQQLEPLVLTPAGRLKGRVVAPDRNASLEGVIISLDAFSLQARADKDGAFDFGRLPVRTYSASAIGRGVVSEGTVSVALAIETEATLELPLKQTPPPLVLQNHAPTIVDGVSFERVSFERLSPNARQLIDTSRLAEGALVRGDTARLRCAAEDVDADPLVYSWQVSGGVVEQVSPTEILWQAQAGSATIRCTATDSQGGFATATRKVDVVDYRLAGAALADRRVVFAQSDTRTPDFDLVVYDIDSEATQALPLAGNQWAPVASGDTIVFASDALATADNPRDVFALTLPSTVPVRLSNTLGVEVYAIGALGIVYADNSGDGCALYWRAAALSSATQIFPIAGATAEAHAECDRLAVGDAQVMLRERSQTAVRWRILALDGTTRDPPSAWAADDAVEVSAAGAAFLVAIPSLREAQRIDPLAPLDPATVVLSLPELAGTVRASIASDGITTAATAFDTSGLFGAVRMARGAITRSVPADGPRVVLAVSGDFVLFGESLHFETLPAKALTLYDWQAP